MSRPMQLAGTCGASLSDGHGPQPLLQLSDLLGLGRESTGAGERRLGFATELGPPALQQTPSNAEIVGHLVHTAPTFHQRHGVFLKLRCEGAADPRGLLGHTTLLLESTY